MPIETGQAKQQERNPVAYPAKEKRKRAPRLRGRGCLRLLVLTCVFLTTTFSLCAVAQHLFYAPFAQRSIYQLQRLARTSNPEPKDSDYIAFSCGKRTYTLKPDGSALRQIHTGYAKSLDWSPDGIWLALPAWNIGGWRKTELFNVRFDGSDTRRLTFNYERESVLRWSKDGTSLDFLSGIQQLYRASADGKDLESIGELDGYTYDSDRIAWSPDGRYFTRLQHWYRSMPFTTLVIRALDDEDRIWEHRVPGNVRGIRWAPDSRRIALGGKELHIYDVETRNTVYLAELSVTYLSWSPNGRWLAVSSQIGRTSAYRLQILDTESGEMRIIREGARFRSSWSPDSEWIAFKLIAPNVYNQLYKIRRDGSALQQLTNLDCGVGMISWSPR